MAFEDMFNTLKHDTAALVVGGAWAAYVIAGHITQNWRNNRQQGLVDQGSSTLVTNLQTMATNANHIAQQERERADRLIRENMELSAEIGSLRSDLSHCRETRADLAAKQDEVETSLENLVVEIRNKDRSITQLVDLNRKLLQSMGSSVDTLEPVSVIVKEIPNERP